jgi:hypothetical protein
MVDEQEDTGILDEIEDPADETTDQDIDGNDETDDDDLAEGAEDDGDNAGEDSPASEDEQDEPADTQGAEKPKGVKSRIDKLVREREDARREAAEKTREAEHYRRLAEEKAKTPPKEDTRPQQGDFENYDDYVEALADWKTRSTTRQIMEEERAQIRAEERQRQVDEHFDAARKRIPDFDEVTRNATASDHVLDIIGESDLVAELAYHLGKNPETVRKLDAMSPTAAAREIGKIEARIQDRLRSSQPPGKQKNGSSPITPTKSLGGGGSGKITKNPDNMTPDEYFRWREEGGGE